MLTPVAIYLRTSTDHQDTGLETQERSLLDYLRLHNITNYTLFKEPGVSGSKNSRPVLNQLMEELRSGKYKTLLVYSFSRFSRSVIHLSSTLQELNKLNIHFKSLTQGFDTSTPMGKAMFHIIAAMAELELESIRENCRRGALNRLAKGLPLGAKKKRNSEAIRTLSSSNKTYREIAKELGCSISTVHAELKKK